MSETEEKTLEQLFDELDSILAQMKDENLSLEDTFKLYKEGLALTESCENKIEKIECDIRLLNPEEE